MQAPKTLSEKILNAHLVDGKLEKGEEIGIKIDQTLTQDATGTKSINVGCIHGLFVDKEKFELIKKISDEVVSTNTFKNIVSRIDVSNTIAKNLI